MIQFELPQNTASIIKVVGVGGGGGNAVNYMYNLGIEGVDFIVCNTDQKALNSSTVPVRIQLGPSLTQGLGAGANPEIGEKACKESLEEIKKLLSDNTKMVFITAGMGGGTGTGGAPIVAKVAKELGILTVGIVTTPFSYEGSKRRRQAEEGINQMRQYVDTILVISNDKLRQLFGNIPTSQAFCRADDILATATKCITDVINSQGHIVVDFADVSTVMRDGGVAILGSATASGENRAYEAVEQAINSPLLNDDSIIGAKWVLLNINSAHGIHEHTLDEVEVIQAYVQEQAGDECDVIFGTGFDDNLGDQLSVTIIATGFDYNSTSQAYSTVVKKPLLEKTKEVFTLETSKPSEAEPPAAFTKEVESPTSEVVLEDPLAPKMIEVEPPAIPNTLGIAFGLAGLALPKTTSTVEPIEIYTLQQEESLSAETSVNEIAPAAIEFQSNAIVMDEPEVVEMKMVELTVEQPVASVQDELNSLFTNEIKTEEAINDEYVTIKGITLNRRKGNRLLSDMELEDAANFELQKRAFDDRAAKLRSLSFNVNKADINADETNIPAYIRKNQPLEDHPASNDTVYSAIEVTNNGTDGISTLNSFLNGKNPD